MKFTRAPSLLIIAVLFAACAAASAQVAMLPSGAGAVDADTAAPEQPNSFGQTVGSIGKTIGEDEWHFVKVPFTKDAIKWDVIVVGTTAILAGTDADENTLHSIPASWHQTSLNISDAALYATAATAGGIYLTGLLTKNEHAQETGIRTAEATADSVIMYGVMKVVFQRQRPFSGAGEGKFFSGNWIHGSFPSGHAMFTWTIASTVAHQYHSVPLQLLLYGLATTVSTTRVTSAQHFPSDVVVGTVLGYFIGDYVSHKPESGFPIRQNKFQRARNAVLDHVSIGVE